jgi:hypothetical protein
MAAPNSTSWGVEKRFLQPFAQFGRDLCRRSSDGVGEFQDQLLVAVEEIAFLIPVQTADLFIAQSCRLTCGRVDVDSKRAFHQLGCADLAQNFERSGNQIDLFQRLAEFCVSDEEVRVSGDGIQRGNFFPQPLTGKTANQCYLQAF